MVNYMFTLTTTYTTLLTGLTSAGLFVCEILQCEIDILDLFLYKAYVNFDISKI